MTGDSKQAKVLDKVRKLLAKADSSATLGEDARRLRFARRPTD